MTEDQKDLLNFVIIFVIAFTVIGVILSIAVLWAMRLWTLA